MKILRNIVWLILVVSWAACFNLNAQNIHKGVSPSWLKQAIFYQIYPQSYKDSNNDGIGDIQGIIGQLDYIKWLGVNAIWINPCFESAYKDAGYDVIDYYKVGKRYGTNEDLQRLFAEAHKRQIRVCLDLVPGHTSIESPWFRASQRKEKNEYTDRYIWTNDSTLKPTKKFVSGHFERNGAYLKNFFDCQPALNYGYANPDPAHPWEQPVTAEGPRKNKEEIMKIIDFWMDKGCDGFRVDMAHSLIKNDKDWVETDKFWHDVRLHMQQRHPEGILLSEWGDPSQSLKAGFTMDFIFQTSNSGYTQLFYNMIGKKIVDSSYFDLRGLGDPTIFANNLAMQLKAAKEYEGYICVPTTNHDRQRPCCRARDTAPQLKTVMALLFTLPTVPLVYYGDEIGMKYREGLPPKEGSVTVINRAGSRTPMQWGKGINAGFSKASPEQLYLPVDTMANFPNVETEKNDPSSLLSFTRTMIKIKKTNSALATNGQIRFLLCKKMTYPLVYERKSKDETIIVVINPSNKAEDLFVNYTGKISKIVPIVQSPSCKLSYAGGKLHILSTAVSYGLYKVD